MSITWGSDRNILSGSELRKRNLAIEVYRSQWPAQCAYMSDIPDFNRFCWQDRKILRALLDFFSWTVKNFESAANLKMQNEKYTFIFIPNIENMDSALPLNEKLKNCGLILQTTIYIKHTLLDLPALTKKNYTKIYVTYTWNILHIYVSYMYSLCRYMLAICICYIYVELGPTYMWHIFKYMGSIWDW